MANAEDTMITENGECDEWKSIQIHVEVLQASRSTARRKEIKECVKRILLYKRTVYNNYVFQRCHFADAFLMDNVDKITILASGCPSNQKLVFTESLLADCSVHVYRVISDDPSLENLENEDGGSQGQIPVGRHWVLPNAEFEGMWENLIFDSNVKDEVLCFAETMLHFADRGVDQNVITSNRVLLFHGPPGTGKTTLCKAVAQKLSIRLNKRYRTGRFLEVNSHSLFSKYFAESGKLVSRLFAKIHEMLDDDTALLVVLIDEVESLTIARKQALSGNEPSDAVRVVNALLTQIDHIRRWPNVLILTTSNLAEAVDPAFLDRADIKQYIGPPSPSAIYQIFYEAAMELRKAGIINESSNRFLLPSCATGVSSSDPVSILLSKMLFDLASRCSGFSGRTIRKLPLLAHAYKLAPRKSVSLADFVEALAYAITKRVEGEGEAGDVARMDGKQSPSAFTIA